MTPRWRAGHLPGLAAGDVHYQTLHFAAHGRALDIEVPLLTDGQTQALAARVRCAAQARLQAMSVDQLIGVIDCAIARLLDPADPLRREADLLLPTVTGFDAEMVSLGLTACLQTFRAPQDGQKPRRLHLNATRLSWPQSPQRRRKKPCARMPQSRKASNLSLTNCGRLAPAASSV